MRDITFRDAEVFGPRLASTISSVLRANFSACEDGPAPEGPHFCYSQASSLFLGRRGRGPLHVAWDTNLLIDYFEHGSPLWNGESLPETLGLEYADELEGLQLLISLWVMRDIRFHILPMVLRDSKRQLSATRVADRRRAFDAFASALALVESGDGHLDAPSRDGLLVLPPSEFDRALEAVPAGGDRALVRQAVVAGVHVFLTRDERVLGCREGLAPFGVLIATPVDLLEELAACGALHCLLAPRFAYWPLPDLQRVSHLIEALPITD